MQINKLLEEAKAKQMQIVAQINALEQQKQSLILEAYKLEGEIRVLLRLVDNKPPDAELPLCPA